MADEIFRPERKKITPADVNADTPEIDPEELQAMAQLRAAVAQDAGRPVDNPPFAEPPAGLKISGNIPPEFRQMMMAKGVKSPDQQKQPSKMNKPQRQAEEQTGIYSVQNGDSTLLKELVEGAKQNHHQYESITLPSLGKFYDGSDGPTDGVLWIRPMTGEEEQILATPRFVKKGQAINMIFQRCMRDKSYRAEDLLTVDRTYLLIWLRGISYTPAYDVEVRCPDCDKKFSHTINLSNMAVEYCPDDFNSPLEGTLPTTNYSFRYRLPRGKDETALQTYRERQLRMFGEAADDTMSERTAMLVEDIENLSNKEELKKLLKALPINDVSYLRNTLNEPPFGVDTTVEISCNNCSHEFEIDLPLEANFFFPRQKGRREKK